ELMYNTGENHKAIAEAVQSMLSEIGIKVKLSNQEWQVFQETRGQASYKDMARHSWIGDYLDPMTFLDMYASVAGKPNPQGGNAYLSSDYDKQIDIAIKTQGKEHYDAYYKAEEILMEDAYIVPIYFYVNKVMANDNLVDWYLSPTGKFWFGDASFSNGTKQLKWNLGVDPKTLDPALNSATDGSHIINNIYEGLYRNKGTGNVPGMAKSHDIVTNSDGTVTYTFHLRDDIKWSDGKSVKADDFEFAWKRAIDPTLGAEYSYMFAPIKNAKAIIAGDMKKDELAVKALDDKTLEVILERPTAYFIDLTAFPTFMPVRSDIVDNEGKWAKDTQKIITNGPFVLSEYAMGSHIVLKKNDNYYNKNAVKLDSIYSAMITEESSMLSAYKAGDVDLITNAPVEEIPQLIAQGEMQTLPYIGTYYFVINANAK
ncbi:MAG: ABC transporter substrate-binding protein, partial [Oscillospiraceae bacterium]